MDIKVGDKIKMQYFGLNDLGIVYTVLEVHGDYIKCKHPDIGGYFQFAKSKVAEVLSPEPEKK